MKRSGRCGTILAAVVLSVSVSTAQEQVASQDPAAAQEQTAVAAEPVAQEPAPASEPVVETPQRVVAPEEPAAPPQEQIVDAPQRVVAPEEPAAAPSEPVVEAPQRVVAPEEPAPAPAEPAAAPPQEPAAAPAEEPAAEEPVEKAEEPATEPEAEPFVEPPQTVKFLDINDALPTRFFDAKATAADPADPNRLVIAFHSAAIDFTTFKANDFRASTAAFSHPAAMDTISFRIEAPKGQRIARVIYTQRGTGSQIRVAKASGATHWVVGDYAAQLGIFGTNPSLVGIADLSEAPQAAVDVSITTGLFAFAAATSGAASVEVTSAEVQVELVPAPEGL